MKLADYLDHRGYVLTLRNSGSIFTQGGPRRWKIWLPGVMLVGISSTICDAEAWGCDPADALRGLVYRVSNPDLPGRRLGWGVSDPGAAVCPPFETGDFLSGPPEQPTERNSMSTPTREVMDDFIDRTGLDLEVRRVPKTGRWSAELQGCVYEGTNPPIYAIVYGDSFPGVVRGLVREIAGKTVRLLTEPEADPVECPEELTVGTMLD